VPRIRQTRELLRVDAELLAHLCQLLGDIHRDGAASATGQAALVLADEAGASPATVFSAKAQIARWRHRDAEAADLAAEGFKRDAPPPLRVLLAYQKAPVLSLLSEYRLSTFVEYMTTVDTLLQQERFNGSADVAGVRAQLADFTHSALATAT